MNIDLTQKTALLCGASQGIGTTLISEANEADFIQAFNMHLQACALLARLAIPGMRAKHYGRIINIISTSVKTPIANLGVSNAAYWMVVKRQHYKKLSCKRRGYSYQLN